MKKLLDDQIAERERVVRELRAKHNDLRHAVEDFNEKIDKAAAEVQRRLDEYNNVLEDARALRDEIEGQQSEYMGERSDKWQNSDTGQNYIGWNEEWMHADLDDGELEIPESIQFDEFDHADTLEGLSESAPE